jgi:anti-sigma factor RsiW
VADRLAAFCEGELPEAEARSVAEHLAACPRCAERRDEIERGLSAVRSLPAVSLPDDRAALVRRALVEPGTAVPPPPVRARRPRALAVAAAVVGAAATFVARRPPAPVLSVEPAGEPLTGFERTAVALRQQAARGTLPLDVASGSPAVVRRWVRERTGLGADLAVQRPGDDAGRFELLGAKDVTLAGARAAAVVYRIDGHPTVLLTARAGDVADRPRAWSLAGKTVRHHADPASGARVLSWTNSGQIYTLVSELPALGLDSCFICHTDAERRRLIRRIGEASPTGPTGLRETPSTGSSPPLRSP